MPSKFEKPRALYHFDRILIETDSPYLAPVPHRGKENQPAYVRDVAEYMAVLKGVSVEQLAEATTENFNRLFHLNVDQPAE
ncbi:Uncharacterized deoxyribonuclease YcfH [Moellerella wisconsensis]|nr:Uncharacterized deoxyribonuclease YcfH [Moellerella wisconsensis]